MPITMTTPIVHPGGRVAWTDAPIPEPGPGEVLVQMETAAICGSDLHSIFGAPRTEPFPPGGPGHEGAGRVAVSRSSRFSEGDHVLTVPDAARGHCFAGYQVVPDAFLVPLPLTLPFDTAVLAQQLGTIVFAMKKFWPGSPGRSAAVLGSGPAGLAFVGTLRRLGFEWVAAIEPRPYRRQAAERMGASLTVDPERETVTEAILAATDGRGVDLVVEASGRDTARQLTPGLVRRDGRIGFFGLPAGPEPVPLAFDVLFSKRVDMALSVGAQFEAELSSFRQAVDWVARELDYWSQLVTHRLPLSQLEQGIRLAKNPDGPILKVVLEISDTGARS
ncbi:MAG: zinc-dependent alcohol dehydrogenase [Clostridia bacterium]